MGPITIGMNGHLEPRGMVAFDQVVQPVLRYEQLTPDIRPGVVRAGKAHRSTLVSNRPASFDRTELQEVVPETGPKSQLVKPAVKFLPPGSWLLSTPGFFSLASS